jgi:KaiC/GvpD/RAD55 family RecA-like ATPase
VHPLSLSKTINTKHEDQCIILGKMPKINEIYADAGDEGLRFILPSATRREKGGLLRQEGDGHLNTIVGRGGSGKSILALQLVTDLLARNNGSDSKPVAAFYFTLEASPRELARQLLQFTWGGPYENWQTSDLSDGRVFKKNASRVSGDDEYAKGLYLIRIPSPVESLNTLNLQIRQTVARQLHQIGGLEAIVIDPMGAVNAGEDLRTSLSELKELAERHHTFIFLLTEKYAFDRHPSIEHYSQSIIHLDHDPSQQQHRRLYVQKARGQGFRSGYHLCELEQARTRQRSDTDKPETNGRRQERGLSKGIRVFPSIEAQAAHAHERLADRQREAEQSSEHTAENQASPSKVGTVPFFPDEDTKSFLGTPEEDAQKKQILVGSAVFLMGPPGTFKEYVAGQFAQAAKNRQGATLFVSFKADIQGKKTFDTRNDIEKPLESEIYVFDARSPLLTPEEVLFTVQRAIMGEANKDNIRFQRAVIWGLRRLYDFPNFREGRAVQFLEALVTLLKSERITSLLVDWPDKKTPSAVPIVDLCQYIFLTRVCFSKESPEVKEKPLAERKSVMADLNKLWTENTAQVALLRAQRTRSGVHHDEGAVLKQLNNADRSIERFKQDKENFERLWLNCGVKWEEDLSLLS